MESQKYSVQEIDDLRTVVKCRYLFGSSITHGNLMSITYRENEMNAAVEDLVRTHMLAGHKALDILVADGYIKKEEE